MSCLSRRLIAANRRCLGEAILGVLSVLAVLLERSWAQTAEDAGAAEEKRGGERAPRYPGSATSQIEANAFA